MILYNVTVNIDNDVHDEWLDWMKTVHIPEVLNTGFFIENKICRILAEEDGGSSYAIQYLCKSTEAFEEYQNNHAPALQQKHIEKYAGKFGAFRTILEIVHQHKLEI